MTYYFSNSGKLSAVCYWIWLKESIKSKPTFQRWINVVSTLWIHVEIMLIRRWKWNKIRRRIFNVAQRWDNISARRWNNVEATLHNAGTTLIQRCFNLVLVKAILNPIGLVMIVDCEIVEYMLNTWIAFILLMRKHFLLNINHSTTNEISKKFPRVVHIVIHNVKGVVLRCSRKKVFLEIS